jgi:hypothetical protein
MIKEIFKKIASKFEKHKNIDHLNRKLTELQQTLEKDIEELSKTHHPHALSISSITKLIVHETLSDDPNKKIIKMSKRNVLELIRHFEISHPKLTESVERFLLMLSNLGA